MSEVDRLRQQTYGGSASTPDSSGRSVGRYAPEVGKSIRELEKIQGREYLKIQTGVMDAEEAVLKAQVDLAEKLLDHKASLESLSQKEAEDYNDNVTKLKTELIKARKDLADKRAAWNTRAVDTAERAARDASTAGKIPAAAASIATLTPAALNGSPLQTRTRKALFLACSKELIKYTSDETLLMQSLTNLKSS